MRPVYPGAASLHGSAPGRAATASGSDVASSAVVAPGPFIDEYARICRAGAPLMQFLCDALDVPF